MTKTLKITFPHKCIGCELCVQEVQRQLGKVGLDGSPIRIFKNKEERILLGEIKFTIEIDNSVNELDIKKIKEICPTGVFTVEETKIKKKDDLEKLLE